MNEAVYNELADWLVTTFRAQPGVKSQELMDILRFQYTPKEARLALDMSPQGGTIDDLTKKIDIPKNTLMSLIKSMEKKGRFIRNPEGKIRYTGPLAWRPWVL